tara:strand:+ start:6904 stop:7425 length:522 start_codon:yes stop_codon:yes gene_type:complete
MKRKANIIRVGSSILPTQQTQQTNTMTTIKIKTTSLVQHKLIINMLGLYGFKIYDRSSIESYSERAYDIWPTFEVDLKTKDIRGVFIRPRDNNVFLWTTEASKIMELIQLIQDKEPQKPYKVTLYQEVYTDVIINADSVAHAEELAMDGSYGADDVDNITSKESVIIEVVELG